MSDRAAAVERLFEKYVEHLFVQRAPLDPSELCAERPELLGELEARIRLFEDIDDQLSARRRLRIGSRLGGYEILDKIGEGAMGFVYSAVETHSQRRVAIKLFPPEWEEDHERRARFEREAEVIGSLDHPNVVRFYSLESNDGLRFITMELVEGSTVAELMPKNGFSLGQTLAIAIPLAEVLQTAHDRGVVHRDLKPSNLMLTGDGQLKVLDFGLACLQADQDVSTLTESGAVLGTMSYMAPEQLLGERVDGRSDLFTFGAVIYEIATGEQPFRTAHLPAMIRSILEEEPPSIESLKPELGAGLTEVIEHCLRKDADERPRSASVVVSALKAL